MRLVIKQIEINKQSKIEMITNLIILILLLPIILAIAIFILFGIGLYWVFNRLKSIFIKKEVQKIMIETIDNEEIKINVLSKKDMQVNLVSFEMDSKTNMMLDKWIDETDSATEEFEEFYHLETSPPIYELENELFTIFSTAIDNCLILQKILLIDDKTISSELISINWVNKTVNNLGEVGGYRLIQTDMPNVISGINRKDEIEITIRQENEN